MGGYILPSLISEEDQQSLETAIEISHLEQFKIVGLFNNNNKSYQLFYQQSQLQQEQKNQSTAEALKGNEKFDPNFNQQISKTIKTNSCFNNLLTQLNKSLIKLNIFANKQFQRQQIDIKFNSNNHIQVLKFSYLITSQFISAIIEKNNLLDIELKEKVYTILKYCFIVQDLDAYFQFDANNPNIQQFLSFYHHNDIISFLRALKKSDIQIEQLLKSG
ncbi:hypothetical protein ABPG72_017728 [Tetrahymena utriculariae]